NFLQVSLKITIEVLEGSGNTNHTAFTPNLSADHMETLTVETPIPTVSSPVPTAYSTNSQDSSSDARLISKRVANQEETPSLDNILSLTNRFEDILGGTTNSDESNGVEANVSNLETTITASPTSTLRIHKDHPKSQIISPVDTPIQTRNKSKEVGKQKPKKISDALQDPSWVEAMQEELLQFKIHKTFLVYASFMGFTVYQMDVMSAFLYGTIDEEVYVMQPPRFQDPEYLTKVYKVEKAMYGLHQASRAWYGTLSKYLLKNGFQRGTINQTFFIRRQRGDFILVQVYMDDIIFGSSNPQLCREFETLMHEKFQMSDMDVRSSNTPMDKENPWGKDGTGKDVDLHLYRSMIGSLIYLTASRPDIMFAVCAYARHQVTPKECHLHTKTYFMACKKQTIVATSITEAEYVATASCCGQVLWIQNQLLDYGDCFEKKLISVDHIHTDENVAYLLTKPFDAGRFQYLVCKLFPLLGKLSTVSVFLGFGLTFAGTSKYLGVLRILMISLRLIPIVSKEKSEHNVDFHPIVDFVEASPLRIETTEEGTKILATVDGVLRTITESSLRRNLKLKDEEGISSLPDAKLFENLTLMRYNISPNQKFTFQKGTPTEPHYTPSPEGQQTSPTTHSSPTLPPVSTALIPTVIPSDTPSLRQYTRRTRIAQSSVLLPVTDEPVSPFGDGSQGEACPTDTGFVVDQDMANIAKTSTLPHDSAPGVTSFAADEGSMQHRLDELTALCTSLQRQHSERVARFEAQGLENESPKARIKVLEDKDRGVAEHSGDDAPIKGRNLDEGEAAAKRVSDDTEEMATVLTSIDAATVLSGGVVKVPTSSGSIPTAGPLAAEVPTSNDVVPTAGLIFATATVVTPYIRRKGKEIMVESETPKKKKVQEQIDAQVTRELEEQIAREDQRMSEQIARDAKIVRIHAEEEL
nr:hypothetical protein [Tanacetum cinerariifolium]